MKYELPTMREQGSGTTFAMVATELAEASQVASSSVPDARAAKSNVRIASPASVRAHSKRVH